MPIRIPVPWRAFLAETDHALVGPADAGQDLLAVAGEGSDISRRHGLYFQRVSVAEVPEGYRSRLIEIAPRGFKRLHLRGLEIHDLVLAKLGRNSARDRADVEFLARERALDRRLLEERFELELRPYVLNEGRHSAAFQLWLQEFF